MSALYAGLDVGGTSVKLLVVDEAGVVVHRSSEQTRRVDTIDQLTRLAAEAVQAHPEIAGVGIVTPGTVHEEMGTVDFASNLDLSGHDIPAEVGAACGRPVGLGHDGRGAGLAETLFGAARGFRSSLVIPIGTGISAAICLPGGVWSGAGQIAGEVGHIPVFPNGEPCACGQRGCLDVYASGKGIANRYLALTGVSRSTREISERLDRDDAAAEVWGTAVEGLALVLTQLTLTLDPEGIVLGGGLSLAGDTLVAPVLARMSELLAWREPPRIVTTELGEEAGQWGAAVLACRAAGSEAYRGWAPGDVTGAERGTRTTPALVAEAAR